MTKTDVLIIGGGPAGMVAAMTARKNYPYKRIILIANEKKGIVPCGIPYIFYRLNSVDQDCVSYQSLLDNDIGLIVEKAIKIEAGKKEVILKNGSKCKYDKLILALGSKAHLISIPGVEKENVWLIKKDYQYLKKMRQEVLKAKNVVIIGGGFIGVELAEELSHIKNLKINIVEMLDYCLLTNFDREFAIAAEEKLKKRGVNIYTKTAVKEIGGKDKVEYVDLENGEKIFADLIILSIGARPNIDLAKKAGIKVEEKGAICVDKYLRTNKVDIFAVGDCAQTKDFITGKDISIMLASVAASEARIVASNLYRLKSFQEDKGTVGVFATYIDNLVLAAAGLVEERAKKEGLNYMVGKAEAPNHHPASLPNTEQIKVKLIFDKSSKGLFLGGEIMGPESISEMINIIAMAIQKKATVYDFNVWQIATHPLLTTAPTVYPLIAAAQDALNNR